VFGAGSALAPAQKPSWNGCQQANDSLTGKTKNRYFFRLGLLFPIDIGGLIRVRQQGPGKTCCLRFQKKKSQTVEKGVPILIIPEDSLPLDSSDDEMVDSTRIINPCFPGHEYTLSKPN